MIRINTTEFGFKNFTIERNATHMRLLFIGMNVLANERTFSVDEICGFGQLNNEFKHWIKFELGKLLCSPVIFMRITRYVYTV